MREHALDSGIDALSWYDDPEDGEDVSKYRVDQKRDYHGRFADEGGGSSGVSEPEMVTVGEGKKRRKPKETTEPEEVSTAGSGSLFGLTEGALAAHKKFDNEYRREKVESLLLTGADGKVHDLLSQGRVDGVSVPTEWQGVIGELYRDPKGPMTGGTVTHNHPAGNSLSTGDVQVFMRAGLREMRAVGVRMDGQLVEYSLTSTDGNALPKFSEINGDQMELVKKHIRVLSDDARRKVVTTERGNSVLSEAGSESADPERYKRVTQLAWNEDSDAIMREFIKAFNKKWKTHLVYTRTLRPSIAVN